MDAADDLAGEKAHHDHARKGPAKSIVALALSAEVEGKTGLYFNQLEPKEPSKLALDDELAERLLGEERAPGETRRASRRGMVGTPTR